jgi:hypothetical protein
MKHAQQGQEPRADEKYGPKEVQKGPKNRSPITQNPVKHVSHEKSGVQKEVKNGPKKQTQKRTLNGPNSTENIPEQFPQNRRKTQ